jgi:hypothetical protein
MGTSRTPAEMIAKVHQLSTITQRQRKIAVSEGALATKTIMLSAAASRGVKPGGKIAGKPWNVRYDVKGADKPVALVRFTGPFHLVNNDTDQHFIGPKGFGSLSALRRLGAGVGAARAFGGTASGIFSSAGAGREFHTHRSGRLVSRQRRGGLALTIGGNLRAYAFHPGTSGKAIFPAAKSVAQRRAPPLMASSMKGAWKQALT